jgi:hypothetical protein
MGRSPNQSNGSNSGFGNARSDFSKSTLFSTLFAGVTRFDLVSIA